MHSTDYNEQEETRTSPEGGLFGEQASDIQQSSYPGPTDQDTPLKEQNATSSFTQYLVEDDGVSLMMPSAPKHKPSTVNREAKLPKKKQPPKNTGERVLYKKPPSDKDSPLAGTGRTPQQRKILLRNILICSGVVLLILILLLVALIPGCTQQPASPSSSLVSSSMGQETSYDKDAYSIPFSQLGNTVLGKTEDAGEEYIEETLFIGDSNTTRLLSFSGSPNVTLANAIGVEGMGIQSVTTSACVRFSGSSKSVTIPQAVKIMQPQRIIITYGTNNAGGMTSQTFIQTYNTALDAIEEAYPAADIIIGAVPPIAQRHINNYLSMQSIDEYNKALAEMADERGHKFLNWTEVLKDTSTGFIKAGYVLESDGIHLTKTALQAMLEYARTHSYITEDDRPKPLNPVPQRIAVPSPFISSAPPKSSSSSFKSPAITSSSSELSSSISLPAQTSSSSSTQPPPSSSAPPVTPIEPETSPSQVTPPVEPEPTPEPTPEPESTPIPPATSTSIIPEGESSSPVPPPVEDISTPTE